MHAIRHMRPYPEGPMRRAVAASRLDDVAARASLPPMSRRFADQPLIKMSLATSIASLAKGIPP